MPHFCGVLSFHATDTQSVATAIQGVRQRGWSALCRNTNLPAEQITSRGLWLATLNGDCDLGTAILGNDAGDLSVVAGLPRSNLPVAEKNTVAPVDTTWLASSHGVFASAHWDSANGRLSLASDKLASRCLYVWLTERHVAFATAMHVLRAMLDSAAVDEQGLGEAILFGQPLANRTVLRNCTVLMPGELRQWSTSGEQTSQLYADYRSVPRSLAKRSEALRVVHDSFSDAVARRLLPGTQDAFLSGGMDSRAVVAELVDQDQTVRSFCTAFPNSADDVISRQVAQSLGLEHICVHRDPSERIRIRLDPFAAYARSHFPPANPEGSRMIWSGDGGSVTLGHVYLDARRMALAAGKIDTATLLALFPQLSRPMSRHLRAPVAKRLKDAAMAGIAAEFARLDTVAPDRRLFMFYMLNDQARHLYHHFETIDLHLTEFLLPFFDSDFVTSIAALPCEWFLDHRFYNDWIRGFRCGAGEHHWQAYPGHEPCPHPPPAVMRDQWGGNWYTSPEVMRAYARMARELSADMPPIVRPYLRREVLLASRLALRLGSARLSHEIGFARNVSEFLA